MPSANFKQNWYQSSSSMDDSVCETSFVLRFFGGFLVSAFAIGVRQDVGVGAFKGCLKDLCIFNESLSQANISYIYNNGCGAFLDTYIPPTAPPALALTIEEPTDVNATLTTRNWSYFNVSSNNELLNCTLYLDGDYIMTNNTNT